MLAACQSHLSGFAAMNRRKTFLVSLSAATTYGVRPLSSFMQGLYCCSRSSEVRVALPDFAASCRGVDWFTITEVLMTSLVSEMDKSFRWSKSEQTPPLFLPFLLLPLVWHSSF
eukprot:Gb_39467 [translate_table: standard]